MKTKRIIGFTGLSLISVFLLAACQNEKEQQGEQNTIIPATSTTTAFSATITGGFGSQYSFDDLNYSSLGILYTDNVEESQALFNSWLAGNNNPNGCKRVTASLNSNGTAQVKLNNLEQKRRYSYCFICRSDDGRRSLGSNGTFTTQTFDPQLTTGDIARLGFFDADLTGTVNEDKDNLVECEVGIIISTDQKTETDNITIKTDIYNKQFSLTAAKLNSNSQYYYCTYVKDPTGKIYRGSVKPLMTMNMFVDLGLPSGTLWAKCNIGANTPEEYGNYYAWGETEPKRDYTWDTYKLKNDKYNTDTTSVRVTSRTEIGVEDDAARVNWGGKWRMPSWSENSELYYYCDITPGESNGVNGFIVTSSINNAQLFIPASGIKRGTQTYHTGTHVFIFLRDLYFCAGSYGYYYNYKSFDGSDPYQGNFYRADGLTIRPVWIPD